MVVYVLLVENLFQQKLRLGFEVPHYLIVLFWRDKLLELAKDMDAATRIVGILRVFKVLNLHEERHELIEPCHIVNIDLQHGLERFLALGKLVHGRVVNRIAPLLRVLLRQDLTIAANDVASVLLKQTDEAQVKLTVPLDRVSIELDLFIELTVLDIHSLHAEAAFLLLQLVVHDLLEAHALVAEQADQAVVVALVGQYVVGAQSIVVDVELMEDHVAWGAHLEREVHSDVLITQVAVKAKLW